MLIRKYYLPLLGLAAATVLFQITQVQKWGTFGLMVLLFSLVGIRKDAKDIPWRKFLPLGVFVLFVLYMIYEYAGGMWHSVVAWQTRSIHHYFQWNQLFNSIPFNDGAWFRLWQPHWLTGYMIWVYENGFTLSYWICVIRAFFTKDVQRIGRYALAGYLLQVPLILIFYNTVLLQEVWYVQGAPDMLDRHLSPEEQYSTAWNCFPSMHTSIAFAAFLLSMREKSGWYRWVVGVYSISIIIATLYLKIHWVIDVIAGMLFAYGCVKLADLIVGSRLFPWISRKFTGVAAGLSTSLKSGVKSLSKMD